MNWLLNQKNICLINSLRLLQAKMSNICLFQLKYLLLFFICYSIQDKCLSSRIEAIWSHIRLSEIVTRNFFHNVSEISRKFWPTTFCHWPTTNCLDSANLSKGCGAGESKMEKVFFVRHTASSAVTSPESCSTNKQCSNVIFVISHLLYHKMHY